MTEQHRPGYRPCVGIMLLNRQGQVWLGRRADAPTEAEGPGRWWQMPQGGIDEAEDPRAAALRELFEETGIRSATIIAELPGWQYYDLPESLKGKAWGGRYIGQRQKWFAARFEGADTEVNITPAPPHQIEFDAWRWAAIGEVEGLIVPFKRNVYAEVVRAFTPLAVPAQGASPMEVALLSGGAAHGLVSAVAARFQSEALATISGTYSAVGAIRDQILAGAPADAIILSKPMIAELTRTGHVAPGAIDLGIVRTAIAVRTGDAVPALATGADLKAAVLAADALYCPDPKLATAGIHFVGILDKLGVRDTVAGRLKTFPNGMTAMTAMAKQADGRPIGCTQVTEILAVPGLTLVGPLPKEYELATTYTAGVAARAVRPDLARQLIALLSAPEAVAIRQRAGFESA